MLNLVALTRIFQKVEKKNFLVVKKYVRFYCTPVQFDIELCYQHFTYDTENINSFGRHPERAEIHFHTPGEDVTCYVITHAKWTGGWAASSSLSGWLYWGLTPL